MNFRPSLVKLLFVLIVVGLSLSANATTFRLVSVNLGNGWVMNGTIDTDGTVGLLTPANITKWNITLTNTVDMVFDPTNTSAANVSMVSTDGKKMYVPASVDGFTDGGTLNFLGGAIGGIPTGALVADFTGWNITGGVAGWQTPSALNYLSLNEPNGTIYTAATILPNKPNTFNLRKVVISTTPTLMTMFGTITTDGTIGPLAAANFKSWRIVGRDQDIQKYNETNSQIINALQVYSDNVTLTVAHNGGDFQIGIPMITPRGRPLIVTLADFTDPAYPNGIASYYYGGQGLVGQRAPLTRNPMYVVAK